MFLSTLVLNVHKTVMQIPTTRAKSPKFGRKKDSPSSDIEGNTSRNLRPVRLSLGEKLSENNTNTKGTPTYPKKPQRKSLPKLPSEKTILTPTNKTNEAESYEITVPKETTEIAPNAEPSYIQPNKDDVAVAETNFVEESIALANWTQTAKERGSIWWVLNPIFMKILPEVRSLSQNDYEGLKDLYYWGLLLWSCL